MKLQKLSETLINLAQESLLGKYDELDLIGDIPNNVRLIHSNRYILLKNRNKLDNSEELYIKASDYIIDLQTKILK